MLIPIKTMTLAYGIRPTNVAHVGAHHAEEFKDYKKYGWGKVLWIEAIVENIKVIQQVISGSQDEIVNAAIWSSSGNLLNFNIASNSQSTSALPFAYHSVLYPDIVKTGDRKIVSITLDELLRTKEIPNFINLDIQGSELEALKGLSNSLYAVKWIYTEVNKQELYESCPLVYEIDEFLKPYGFFRFKTRWVLNHGGGDALYVKNRPPKFKLKSLGYRFLDWSMWVLSQNIYRLKLVIHRCLEKAKSD